MGSLSEGPAVGQGGGTGGNQVPFIRKTVETTSPRTILIFISKPATVITEKHHFGNVTKVCKGLEPGASRSPRSGSGWRDTGSADFWSGGGEDQIYLK